MAELEIVAANSNHINKNASKKDKLATLMHGVEWHRNFLARTGYDGYEWYPIRDHMQAEIGMLSVLGYFQNVEEGQPLIATARQSFIDESDPLSRRLLLPSAMKSFKAIERMQAYIGRTLDTVVHVGALSPQEDYRHYSDALGELAARPSPDVWEMYKIQDSEGEQNVLGELGITAYVLDTFHERLTARGGGNFSKKNNQTDWAKLAATGKVSEIRISVGRVDYIHRDNEMAGKSLAELSRLIGNHRNFGWARTGLYDLVQLAETNMPSGVAPRIVVDVPGAALHGEDAIACHARIVENIRAHYPRESTT